MMCFFVGADQNDAAAQLMSHASKMSANNWVGQVKAHPLQRRASNWLRLWSMSQVVLSNCIKHHLAQGRGYQTPRDCRRRRERKQWSPATRTRTARPRAKG